MVFSLKENTHAELRGALNFQIGPDRHGLYYLSGRVLNSFGDSTEIGDAENLLRNPLQP
jgi:hypothetical protein